MLSDSLSWKVFIALYSVFHMKSDRNSCVTNEERALAGHPHSCLITEEGGFERQIFGFWKVTEMVGHSAKSDVGKTYGMGVPRAV